MRFVVGSIVVHLVALVVLLRARERAPEVPVTAVVAATAAPAEQLTETELVFDVIGTSTNAGGGSSGTAPSPATRSAARTSDSAHAPTPGSARTSSTPDKVWEQLEISEERARGGDGGGLGAGNGHGDGGGLGDGHGAGIGFGTGGGIRAAERVPDPPRVIAPPPSRARPAKLIYPVRDREVDDEGNLFIARITVDTDGDVVGAHMVKTRPGVTGDQASSAIWTFRYLPALDDRGTPIRSTFDQPFQIR